MYDFDEKTRSAKYYRTPIKRHTMRDRPSLVPVRPVVPDHWIICNAPRPLYGDIEFNGDFITGVLYAAIDPEGPDAALYLHKNDELAAVQLVFHDKEELVVYALEYYQREFPKTYEEIDPTNPQIERHLITRALDLLNDQEKEAYEQRREEERKR